MFNVNTEYHEWISLSWIFISLSVYFSNYICVSLITIISVRTTLWKIIEENGLFDEEQENYVEWFIARFLQNLLHQYLVLNLLHQYIVINLLDHYLWKFSTKYQRSMTSGRKNSWKHLWTKSCKKRRCALNFVEVSSVLNHFIPVSCGHL